MATVPFLIDGQPVVAEHTFPVVSPATGETVHLASGARPADAVAAVAAAAAAFPGWAATPPKTRRDILLRAAEGMQARRAELAGYQQAETGATAAWARFNVDLAADLLRDAAGRAMTAQPGGALPTEDSETSALVWHEPYGVVVAVAPWNAPHILATRAVAYPLAAGNAVVLKGSERAPRSMWAVASVLAAAGVPAGAVNVVYAAAADAEAVTEALVAQPAVRKINFTGSTAVGRIVGRLAGAHLKPVLLELGGKAPAIVWRDADLDAAADHCARGAFLHAGQICMSTERILVHRAVRAAFVPKLAASIAKLWGDHTPVLVSSAAADKTRALVQDALDEGATLAVGQLETGQTGARMAPVVVADVTPAMRIYDTETFGPAVSLLEADSEQEALRLANDTAFGLTAAVFTEDLRRGLRMARAIDAGAVHINGMTVHDEAGLPHGGVKASGFGRFNGGLEEWVKTKTVTYR